MHNPVCGDSNIHMVNIMKSISKTFSTSLLVSLLSVSISTSTIAASRTDDATKATEISSIKKIVLKNTSGFEVTDVVISPTRSKDRTLKVVVKSTGDKALSKHTCVVARNNLNRDRTHAHSANTYSVTNCNRTSKALVIHMTIKLSTKKPNVNRPKSLLGLN